MFWSARKGPLHNDGYNRYKIVTSAWRPAWLRNWQFIYHGVCNRLIRLFCMTIDELQMQVRVTHTQSIEPHVLTNCNCFPSDLDEKTVWVSTVVFWICKEPLVAVVIPLKGRLGRVTRRTMAYRFYEARCLDSSLSGKMRFRPHNFLALHSNTTKYQCQLLRG